MKQIFKIILVAVLGLTLTSCSNAIKVSFGSDDIIGSKYNLVVDQLQEDGFNDIQAVIIDDLNSDRANREGLIESILIGESNSFAANTSFPKDSIVVITYHSIKKANPPFSYSDLEGMTQDEVSTAFREAGFENLVFDEVYDLNPEEHTSEELEVSVNGDSVFDVLDNLPYDSEVKIIKHYPYELYNLKLHVECRDNLMFSRYDVAISVDSQKYNLDHGKTEDYELKLPEGEYTITFTDVEDSDVKGTANIDISTNTEASYYIWCESNKITVTENYIDREVELSANEIKMPNSLTYYEGLSYSEAEAAFKTLGFTSIKTVPQYDIVWGITKEGSIDSITIGNATEFTRGTIFKKNDAITIVYHLKEDDDPSKATPTPKSTTTTSSTAATSSNGWYGHSSDNMKTAKEGNSGVYAFKKSGSSYDQYIIIDFDEGYVYRFSQGDGNTTCDKIKIDSGDLNNGLYYTYHDGNDSWQEILHFRWSKQPDHLVLVDGFEYTYDFYYTDLSTALSYKRGKTIYEY